MAVVEAKLTAQTGEAVAAYKRLLAAIIDRRPSGTRQRLAAALGKNRSFVSQIINPAYPTPIPSKHLEHVFEVCHFSAEEKRHFLAAYIQAHPGRPPPLPDSHKLKPHTVYLPDLGDPKRNLRLQKAIDNFVQLITPLIDTDTAKRKRP